MHTGFIVRVLFYLQNWGMGYVEVNTNPKGKRVNDCVIRAISTATGKTWDEIYIDLMLEGFYFKDYPNANYIWGDYLKNIGYTKHIIPDDCPECYSIREFADDNPDGIYIVATGSHVVAVADGDYYDTWDSGDEVPVYYYRKEEQNNGI